MHELWLCQRLLEIVHEKATTLRYYQIKTIHLEIGELVAIEKSALLFSFDVVAQGTLAEGAQLRFIMVPGKAWCERCQKEIYIKQLYQTCGSCNNYSLRIMSGEEFRVHAMEVE